ncbi:MAG: histone [Thermoproteota archaeon]|nr:MAG: histone [Candidatus Korarchaeota archaeon]
MVRVGELSVSATRRICKKAGAERVSKSAATELARILEEIGVEIAKEGFGFAKHAGRKTLKGVDVRIAVKKVFG